MGEPCYIHVVDSDSARRAQIARQLYGRSYHAEIYESIDELIDRAPDRGAVLICDDVGAPESDVSLETIRARTSYLPVAYFSENPSPDRIVRAMLRGALDYLQWPISTEALDAAVTRLGDEGERQAKIERRKAEARQRVERLTPRERDVLVGLIAGASNKHIAQELGISPRTVEIHRGNMMSRLNARSVSDAVRLGLYAGLSD